MVSDYILIARHELLGPMNSIGRTKETRDISDKLSKNRAELKVIISLIIKYGLNIKHISHCALWIIFHTTSWTILNSIGYNTL